MLDPSADRLYLPVRDSQDRPDAAQLSGVIGSISTIQLGYVTFPAPPGSVSSLDVLLPEGGLR